MLTTCRPGRDSPIIVKIYIAIDCRAIDFSVFGISVVAMVFNGISVGTVRRCILALGLNVRRMMIVAHDSRSAKTKWEDPTPNHGGNNGNIHFW